MGALLLALHVGIPHLVLSFPSQAASALLEECSSILQRTGQEQYMRAAFLFTVSFCRLL
jgi:hypothetical protein